MSSPSSLTFSILLEIQSDNDVINSSPPSPSRKASNCLFFSSNDKLGALRLEEFSRRLRNASREEVVEADRDDDSVETLTSRRDSFSRLVFSSEC